MIISEKIFELIKARGMSQKDFALATGISQSTISDWRRKGTNPSADKIMIICDVLDVSPYELLTGAESKLKKKSEAEDYFVLDKGSKEYRLIAEYRDLDIYAKNRLEGYMAALKDMGNNVK